MKKALLCIAILFSLTTLYSQKYAFTGFSIREGLPNSHVTVLFQDSRGLIWIGTMGGGVAQYDGYSFYTLSESEGLAGNQVSAIAEDSTGLMWFGTNKGICTFDGKKITNYSGKINADAVNALYFDRKGILWVLTANSGIYKLNPINIEVQKLNPGKKSTSQSDKFYDIDEDNFGRIWLATDSGLTILSSDRYNAIKLQGLTNILPIDRITALEKGPGDEMWIGTQNNGAFLIQYNSDSCSLKRSYNSYFDNIDDNIVSIKVDKQNKTWIGTDNSGLVYIDFPFVKKLTGENGLESDRVTTILDDNEGNIWVGTGDNGVKVFAGWHFIHYGTQSGFSDNSINAIDQDNDGNYWCSGFNGLYRVLRRGDQIKVFNVLLPENYYNANISTINFSSSGEIIFGSTNYGILRIKDNAILNFNMDKGLPDNDVTSVFNDVSDKLWVGTKYGLAIIQDSAITNLTRKSVALESGINCITGDDNGNIWAGTNQGIVQFSNDSVFNIREKNGLRNIHVNSLLADKDSNLWIGTMGGGLYYAKIKNRGNTKLAVLPFLSGSELVSGNIYSLAEINDSTLMAGTDKGANRIQYKNDSLPVVKAVYSYNSSNGFINTECNLNSILTDNSGYVWFGTKSGLTCYDHLRENTLRAKPKMYITGLMVNFKSVKWQSASNKENEWFSFPPDLKLKHNQNYVNFEFSGIYYSGELEYQYFLEGLDKDWSTPGTQRYVNFSKLNPGNYTFRVRAVTKTGLVSNESTFSFTIKPPFWGTWWFTVLWLIVVIIAVIWIIKYRERQLRHAKEVLEETVKIRTEEIREQKTHIEKQKKELTDSIEYAKRIQDAVISKPQNIERYFGSYFIIYLPRDIVSGDFYWFGETDNKFIFSVADCTGHGVPGAFMSMLGIRLLNEIVLERKVIAPNEILDELRNGVINALQQKSENPDTRDGMDMSLCVYDKKTGKLHFAGANHTLRIIRDNEIIALKGDRMPVAIHERLNNFSLLEFECRKGDLVYLWSDGFADQFGGPDQKKYLPKHLERTLLTITRLPMQDQKEYLLNEFNSWKGENEQIDDVTMLGVKV